MTPREFKIAKVILVVLVVLVVLGLVPLFVSETAEYWWKRGSRSSANAKIIGSALSIYEVRHGAFPYDERGWQYALYKLKEVELPASAFESPARRERDRAPFYDDELEALVGSDYLYLNRPGMTYKTDNQRIVICERTGVRENGWLCISPSRIAQFVPKETVLPEGRDNPLGLWANSSTNLTEEPLPPRFPRLRPPPTSPTDPPVAPQKPGT